MPRVQTLGAHKVYEAAERFVNAALRRDDSLFTPGQPVWSEGNLDELMQKFVENPDESSKNFIDKLRDQLAEASSEAIQLMGEALYVHFLLPTNVSGKRRREVVREVLGWAASPVEIPQDLAKVLDEGLVNPGTHYNTGRPSHLAFLIGFAAHWKQLAANEQKRLLNDAWAFKAFVHGLPNRSAFTQREGLLHLVHPDTFEPVVSREHKKLIAKSFASLVTEATDDVDRKIVQIRAALEKKHGAGFNFWDPLLKQEWSPGKGAWEEFVRWARRIYADLERFDEMERTYKLAVMAEVARARQALQEESEEWVDALQRAFLHPKNNLSPWQAHNRFLAWTKEDPEAARAALEKLWHPGEVETDRMREFLEGVPRSVLRGAGGRLPIASFLLMGCDPTNYPIFRATPFKRAFDLTEATPPPKGSDEADRYDHALEFLDRFLAEAETRGLVLRDRLDAQGLVWGIAKSPPPDTWSDADQRAFRRYRGEDIDNGDGDGVTLADLANELLLDERYLARVERLLNDKRQLIFFGPPGTGKTYVAERLARHFAGEEGEVTLVQFHPSYAYEDFVEGYRPSPDPAQGAFSLHEGPLKQLAKTAAENPGATHVLVIDELNRGNLAKVFGELYFLLEYRGRDVHLQYSDDPFRLPSNLWVIGTMNTADRSIALVDSALRRRFYFVPFFPDEPPVKGLLDRWLARHRPEMAWVAGVLERANRLLDDRHVAVGPSHFLRKELDDDWVEIVWEHSVLPYLAEHFFGEEERLSAFALRTLKADAHRKPADEAGPADELGDEDDAHSDVG